MDLKLQEVDIRSPLRPALRHLGHRRQRQEEELADLGLRMEVRRRLDRVIRREDLSIRGISLWASSKMRRTGGFLVWLSECLTNNRLSYLTDDGEMKRTRYDLVVIDTPGFWYSTKQAFH